MRLEEPAWVRDAIFYQIFPDRFYNGNRENDPGNLSQWGDKPTRNSFFGGDLEGIIQKLPYLEELGVNALYLNPIFKAPSNHKYDTEDYYQVDPHFGDKEVLKRLVAELHRRGMRIILDGVFNHCGTRFFAFQDVEKRGADSKYKDWFIIDGFPIVRKPEPNYRCWAGVPTMPEFNTDNPEVRQYLLNIVKYWIEEADIDGWRLDAVEFMDPSFVKEIRRVAKEAKEGAYIVGEVMGIATPWFNHAALDAAMNYRLWEALVDFFATSKMSASEFSRTLYSLRKSYPDWATYSMFNLLGSHDKPRFLTLSNGDKRRLKLAAAFLFSYPGAPVIYYGDEIGLSGGEDPDCRRTFIWEENKQDRELLAFFKRLIHLRKQEKVLRRGKVHELWWPVSRTVGLLRTCGTEQLLTLFNASNEPANLELSTGRFGFHDVPLVELLGHAPRPARATLGPWEFALLKI